MTITGSGSTDTPAADGVNHYEYRTSTDGGTTWSAGTSGAAAVVSAEGTTLVQFRAVDGAGNVSAWVPAVAGATNTVKLDRGAPTNPTVSGATGAWSNAASVVVTASGSTDGGSSVSGYQYQTSFNGGAFSASTSGSSVTVSAQGTTVVQFRALDAAGNTSAWVQGTVKLDRTAPDEPDRLGRLDELVGGRVADDLGEQRDRRAVGPRAVRVPHVHEQRLDVGRDDGRRVGGHRRRGHDHRPVPLGRQRRQRVVVAPDDRRVEQHGEARPDGAQPADGERRIAHLHEQPHHDPRVGLDRHDVGLLDLPVPLLDERRHDLGLDVTGSSVQFRSAGTYIVQFRAVDRVGNTSAWNPLVAGAANTACHT